MRRRRRTSTPCRGCAADRDEGAALVLVLVVIIVATLIVTPMLAYAVAVTRASRVSTDKAVRVEAVKAGLRAALANPKELYKACKSPNSGLNTARVLASPPLATPIQTTCNELDSKMAEDETKRPYGVASVQANVPLPPALAAQPNSYPGSGNADNNAWQLNDTSVTRTQYKVWTPNLPVRALSPRSPTPLAMPPEFGNCLVYFPGTYINPVSIISATPVFFTSGIYYFENTVTISGDANVVVGGGAVEGCTTDQEAAFYALNAPASHNITGLGSTFVFGLTGRLVVNNSTPGTATRLIFNQRYVSATDANTKPSETVNIISVNGYLPGSDLANAPTDFFLANTLTVPLSQAPTTNGSLGPATMNKYRPSTLVPPDLVVTPGAPDTDPIIDISFSATSTVTVQVPGYVSVPQGRFRLDVPAASGFGANKTVEFKGGLLARTIEIPGDNPASLTISVAEVVVQLELRIRTRTTSATPVVVSDAIVQVNENGAYAVNSWSVQ